MGNVKTTNLDKMKFRVSKIKQNKRVWWPNFFRDKNFAIPPLIAIFLFLFCIRGKKKKITKYWLNCMILERVFHHRRQRIFHGLRMWCMCTTHTGIMKLKKGEKEGVRIFPNLSLTGKIWKQKTQQINITVNKFKKGRTYSRKLFFILFLF